MYKIQTVYGVYYRASHANLIDYKLAAWFCNVPQAAIVKVEFIGLREFISEKPIDK